MLIPFLLVGCDFGWEPKDPLENYTQISGSLSGRLSASGSPFAAVGDIRVEEGASLTIEPGVEIAFNGDYSFQINGTLDATGTGGNMIVFTAFRPKEGSSQMWRGIVFNNSQSTSYLEYCKVEYANVWDTLKVYHGAITCNHSSPVLKHNLIVYGKFDGIHCLDNSEPTIVNNTIYNNSWTGISIYNSSPTVKNNIAFYNWDYGIYWSFDSNPGISYNAVYVNQSGDYYYGDSLAVGYGGRQLASVNANGDSCDIHYNIAMHPKFKDEETGDFSLQSISPCIGAGDIVYHDDIGAFDYVIQPNELRKFITQDLTLGLSPYVVTNNVVIDVQITINIDPGVEIRFTGPYYLLINGKLNAVGTLTNPIRFTSAEENPQKGDWRNLIFTPNADNGSQIKNCVIEYGSTHMINVEGKNEDYGGVIVCEGVSPTIQNNIIQHNFYSGIWCRQGSPEIIGNQIIDCSVSGIFADSSSHPIIRQNIFKQNDGYGIWCLNYSDPEIKNNIIYGNTYEGIKCLGSSAPDIINNTIYTNGQDGILCEDQANATILNNIIGDNVFYGIECYDSSNPSINYNDVWNNRGGNYKRCSPGEGDISEDPLFVGGDPFDYHLQPGSPCIDAGDPDAQYNDVDDLRNDMGAYGGPYGNW